MKKIILIMLVSLMYTACNEKSEDPFLSPIQSLEQSEYLKAKEMGRLHNQFLDEISEYYKGLESESLSEISIGNKLIKIKEFIVQQHVHDDYNKLILENSIKNINSMYIISPNSLTRVSDVSDVLSSLYLGFIEEISNNNITDEEGVVSIINAKNDLTENDIYALSIIGFTYINSVEYWGEEENVYKWLEFYGIDVTRTKGFWKDLWYAVKQTTKYDAAGAAAVLLEAGAMAATGVGAPLAGATVATAACCSSIVGLAGELGGAW
jgi:hypothetical protein